MGVRTILVTVIKSPADSQQLRCSFQRTQCCWEIGVPRAWSLVLYLQLLDSLSQAAAAAGGCELGCGRGPHGKFPDDAMSAGVDGKLHSSCRGRVHALGQVAPRSVVPAAAGAQRELHLQTRPTTQPHDHRKFSFFTTAHGSMRGKVLCGLDQTPASGQVSIEFSKATQSNAQGG